MTPLRFCFLTTFYPPHNFGGDGIGVQRLARALAWRGHHVTVVHDVDAFDVLRRGPKPPPQPAEPNLQVVPLRSGLGALSPLLTQQTGRPLVNGRRIRAILDDGGFDVVNFNNISLIGGPGLLSYGGSSVRMYLAHEHWLVCPNHVLWRHNQEVCTGRQCVRCSLHFRRPPQLWRFTGYLGRQLQYVDGFIAMSEFSRDKHRELGFPYEMDVLPYFLPDPDSAARTCVSRASPHPRPYFLYVGRLERIKGLDDVIPAFQGYHAADLVIAGDGDHAPALNRLAQGNPRVTFLGRVDGADLAQYYEHALALVVPSVGFETFGVVLIEAFRYGIPVIARRIGPFPEIVQQSGGGELFDTAGELLSAMARLQQDEPRRQAMGRAGYQAYCHHWSESAVVPKYLEIVRRAAERRETRAR